MEHNFIRNDNEHPTVRVDDRVRQTCRLLGYFSDEEAKKGQEVYHDLVADRKSVINLNDDEGIALHDFAYSQHCYLVDTTPLADRMYRPGVNIDFFYSRALADHIPIIPSPQVVLHSLCNHSYMVLMAIDFTNGDRASAFFKGPEPIPMDFISGLVRSLKKGGIETIKMVVQPTPESEQEYVSIDFDPMN